MQMVLENTPPARVAYVRVTGPFGQGNVRAMTEIKRWAGQRGLLADKAILFGIPRDNPVTTPAAECRYDAAITINAPIIERYVPEMLARHTCQLCVPIREHRDDLGATDGCYASV